MRRTKRLGALLIALAMLFTMIPFISASAVDSNGTIVLTMNSTEFTVNGTKTKIDEQGSKPVQTKGYTMLPLRAIMEATGGTLGYDGATQKITITRGGDTVVLTLGSNTAAVNGANRTLGAAPYATNSRTMVHIRTLELFGMKVDWDAATNVVTVNYTASNQIYNLTLQNGMGTPYTTIQIAPMTTGEPAWSGNLLGADTLNINQNLVVQAPLTGTGYYQMRCGYASSGQTLYHTIQNINLTGIREKATILMNSTTAPGVTIDGASATSRNIQLFIVNNTGKTLSGLYYKPSTEQYYGLTNLLGSQMLVTGGQATAVFNYDSNVPYYDFYATYQTPTTGTTAAAGETYTRVQLNISNGSQTFATLTLGINGSTLGTANNTTPSTSTTGNTAVRFTNSSGMTIYELRASTSSRSTSIRNGEVLWSDSSGLKSGRSVEFNMDLGSNSEWYFGVVTTRNSSSSYSDYIGKVDFKRTSCISARVSFLIDDEYELYDWRDCEECGTDDYDYDRYRRGDYDSRDNYSDIKDLFEDAESTHDKLKNSIDEDDYNELSRSDRRHYESTDSGGAFSVSDLKYDGSDSSASRTGNGNVDLVILNNTNDDIKALYAIDKDDYDSDMSKYDFEEVDEDNDFINLLDDDTLDSADYERIADALDSGKTYYFVAFTSTSRSASPLNTIRNWSLKVDRDADYAVIQISNKSTFSAFDSEDEQYLIWIVNESSDDIDRISFVEDGRSSSHGSYTEIKNLKEDMCTSITLDVDDYGLNWDVEVDFNSRSDLDEDLNLKNIDYGFVHMTVSNNRIDFDEVK